MYSLHTYLLHSMKQTTLELQTLTLWTALLCVQTGKEKEWRKTGSASLALWPWPVTSPVHEPQLAYLCEGICNNSLIVLLESWMRAPTKHALAQCLSQSDSRGTSLHLPSPLQGQCPHVPIAAIVCDRSAVTPKGASKFLPRVLLHSFDGLYPSH